MLQMYIYTLPNAVQNPKQEACMCEMTVHTSTCTLYMYLLVLKVACWIHLPLCFRNHP